MLATYIDYSSPCIFVICKQLHKHYILCYTLCLVKYRLTKKLTSNFQELAVQVPNIFMPRPFQAWKLICRRIWRRRGNLVGRFYTNIRRMLTLRLIGEKIKSDAIVHWVGVMKYNTLGVWINWIRSKKRIRAPRY